MSSDNIITETIIEGSNLSKNVSSIITSYLIFDLKEFMKFEYKYKELKCDSKCDIRTHLCLTCYEHAEYGDLNYLNSGYYTHCLKCKPLIRCKNPQINRDRSRWSHSNNPYTSPNKFDEDILKYINDFCRPYICDFCNVKTCIHDLYLSETSSSTICMDCKNNMILGLKMVKAFQKKPKTLEEFYSYI